MLESVEQLIAEIPPSTLQIVGTWLAALLTLSVLSYIVGYAGLYRLAGHLFIGVSAGYAGGLVWNSVLWPRVQLLLSDPAQYWSYGLFFVLGLLLLTRGIGPISIAADIPLAIMFGVGAALALIGAAGGTLVPQIRAAIMPIVPERYGAGAAGWTLAIDAFLLLVGTLAVLAGFHYARPSTEKSAPGLAFMAHLGKAGRKLLIVAIGTLFAGALISFYTVLVSRVQFLMYDWGSLLGIVGF